MTRIASALLAAVVWAQPVASLGADDADKAKATKDDKAESKQKPEDDKKTAKVKQERLRVTVELDGTFAPTRSAEIALHPDEWTSFEVSKVVEHGARVKKGEPLIWLDTEMIDRQIASTRQGYELGQIGLSQAETQLKLLKETTPLDMQAAERTKQVADEDLDYFLKVSRPRSEKSARFSVDRAQYSLEYAQEELKQLEKMYKADDLTEETEEIILKRAQRSVESAEFFLESAQIRAERTLQTELPRQEKTLKEGATRQSISLARSRVSLPADLNKARLELEKLRFSQEVAEDKLAGLRRDRESMILRAPLDGVVYYGKWTRGKWEGKSSVENSLRPGGKLSPRQPFMTVVAERPLTIRADVPEKQLADVGPGVTGTAKPTAFAKRQLPVKVARVSAVPVSSGTFDGVLDVTFEDSDRVVPGMTCKVELVVYDKKDALTVPSSAIFDDDGEKHVYLAGEKPKRQEVTVGRTNKGRTEVTKGLSEGDEILLSKPDAKD